MTDDFEDHCWKDVIAPDVLEIYADYRRKIYVGPRPALRYEVEQYRYRHRYRLLVTPGLTGIWQVYGRSKVDFETLVSMDLHYVTDGSIWLDLKLIVLTFGVVFKQSGGK